MENTVNCSLEPDLTGRLLPSPRATSPRAAEAIELASYKLPSIALSNPNEP